jgi:hypothetical protein
VRELCRCLSVAAGSPTDAACQAERRPARAMISARARRASFAGRASGNTAATSRSRRMRSAPRRESNFIPPTGSLAKWIIGEVVFLQQSSASALLAPIFSRGAIERMRIMRSKMGSSRQCSGTGWPAERCDIRLRRRHGHRRQSSVSITYSEYLPHLNPCSGAPAPNDERVHQPFMVVDPCASTDCAPAPAGIEGRSHQSSRGLSHGCGPSVSENAH